MAIRLKLLADIVNSKIVIGLNLSTDKNTSASKKVGLLTFREFSDINDKVVICIDNSDGDKMGYIKWQASVDRYIFVPFCLTVYDHECLAIISDFLKEL